MESTKREFQRSSVALKKCYRSVTFYKQFAEQAEERSSLEFHSCCAQDRQTLATRASTVESKVCVN